MPEKYEDEKGILCANFVHDINALISVLIYLADHSYCAAG